jgi:hypothetical protein
VRTETTEGDVDLLREGAHLAQAVVEAEVTKLSKSCP